MGNKSTKETTLDKLTRLGNEYNFHCCGNMNQNIINVFDQAIRLDDLPTIKWLFSSGIIINTNIQNIEIYQRFYYACCLGRLTIAQWLYNLEGSRFNNFTIGVTFDLSCQSDKNLEVLKWLFSLGLPDYMKFDHSFYFACNHRCMDIAKWLLTVDRISNETFNKYIVFFDDYSVYELAFKLKYKPINDLSLYKYESQSDVDLYRNKLRQNYKRYLVKRSKYLWFICKVVTKLLVPFLIHKKYSPNESGFQVTKDHFEELVQV